MKLFSDTKILADGQPLSVILAAADLARDLKKACCLSSREGEGQGEKGICKGIRLRKGNEEQECYRLFVEGEELICEAADDLGFIYGIYGISRDLLGIQDFWFWNDQAIPVKTFRQVEEDYGKQSKPFAVRLRGWFINDEVLLHTWKVEQRKEGPWEMALETLLRCGGNMVIPGTDKNARMNRKLVFDRGLYLTHHHAEPLGAEMFARAYPERTPSYDQYGEEYRQLWQEAIEEQKGHRMVWNIGFRGQGDVPFWENDPGYDTPAARGGSDQPPDRDAVPHGQGGGSGGNLLHEPLRGNHGTVPGGISKAAGGCDFHLGGQRFRENGDTQAGQPQSQDTGAAGKGSRGQARNLLSCVLL